MSKNLLALLQQHPELDPRAAAQLLSLTEKEMAAEIDRLQKAGKLIGWKAVLPASPGEVTAMVEVRVATRRGRGFDEVAERIAQFPEVASVYLISGTHDLNVQIRGKNLQEVASFVSSKLAAVEDVLGTQTHFILKKYKDDGILLAPKKADTRLKVSA